MKIENTEALIEKLRQARRALVDGLRTDFVELHMDVRYAEQALHKAMEEASR